MKLSELIIRRQIRRILQEAVPTSTAVAGTFGYAANPRGGAKGSFERKIVLGVLGAIGARILYGILKGDTTPEKEAKLNMKAVICGDSQGKGYLGNEVGKILSSQGYKVSNVSVNGAGPDAVLDQVKAHAKNALLVVAIFGGNTSSATKSADGVVKMYEHCEQQGTAFMAIGPPPVTEITDSGEVAKRGGDKNYWLSLSSSDIHSQDKRKEISDAMESATSSSGEPINVYGVASNWRPKEENGKYPDQPDGLHCQMGAAEVARAAMDALGIDNVTAQLKKELGVKQYDADDLGRVGKAGEVNESNFNVDQYKKGIHGPESSGKGNPYAAINKPNPPEYSGAYGKYQFLVSSNTESLVAFLNANRGYSLYSGGKYSGLTRSDWNNPRKKKLVYDLWNGFLSDKNLQEKFMDQFAEKTKEDILEIYKRTRNNSSSVLSKLDLAQLCAIAHLGGKGGLMKVESLNDLNITPGGNNSTYAVYLDRFNKFFYES